MLKSGQHKKHEFFYKMWFEYLAFVSQQGDK